MYNRVSGFIGTMQRDSSDFWEGFSSSQETKKTADFNETTEAGHEEGEVDAEDGMTICIVTHGLTMRLFLMRWFQYTVHEFERSYNPDNGRVVVLQLKTKGKNDGHSYFELSEVDRMAMGFPLYWEQERFLLLNDYSLLDESDW